MAQNRIPIDPGVFEQQAAAGFVEIGYEVHFPVANQPFYDFIATKRDEKIAVQVKYRNQANISMPLVRQLYDYYLSNVAEISGVAFVTNTHYSVPAREFRAQQIVAAKLKLYILGDNGSLYYADNVGENPITNALQQTRGQVHIGVFTAKGGVGKTTIAAHLAGAFAYNGLNVALVDLDHEENLLNLLQDGIYIPGKRQGEPGTVIEVISWAEWVETPRDENHMVVIYDCSPAVERNDADIVKDFNYCIVPITLSPLGISKKCIVIQNTISQIRSINPDAIIMILVNQYRPSRSQPQVSRDIFKYFEDEIKEVLDGDSKTMLINPRRIAIRDSQQLYYWGRHALLGGEQGLAFEFRGNRSYPREDFMNLADHLAELTERFTVTPNIPH